MMFSISVWPPSVSAHPAVEQISRFFSGSVSNGVSLPLDKVCCGQDLLKSAVAPMGLPWDSTGPF